MISVIIPAYNSGSTIIETLESVAAQTYLDYEVIVVNDCSKDNTVEVVERWMREQKEARSKMQDAGSCDSRWTLLQLSVNGGPAVARNAGIAAAKGEWVAFLDADDMWFPEKLEFQSRLASQHPEVVLWCADCTGFSEGEPIDRCQVAKLLCDSGDAPSSLPAATQQPNNTVTALREITLEELGFHNPIATSTVLVKRAVLGTVGGFDPQFCGPEDYELWLRVAAYGMQDPGCRIQDAGSQCSALPESLPNHQSGGLDVDSGRARRLAEPSCGTMSDREQVPRIQHPASCILPPVSECPLVHINVPVTYYRHTEGSLSTDDRKFLPQVMRVLDKAYGPAGVLKGKRGYARAVSYQMAAAAWNAAERGDATRAWVTLVRSIARWPWPLGWSAELRWVRSKVGFYIIQSMGKHRGSAA